MKIVIFGTGRGAELAWYCLCHDSEHRVVGFTADAGHLDRSNLHGLPVCAFEDVERHFPPEQVAMLIPLGYAARNRLRAERYRQAEEKGYRFARYISSRAMVWPDLEIGDNCMIHDGAIVQPFARIGHNTIIRSGAHVSHHVSIGDHCFLAPRAALASSVVVGDFSVVGLNATVRDEVVLAPSTFLAAGAVVVRDTEAGGLYKGIPAVLERGMDVTPL